MTPAEITNGLMSSILNGSPPWLRANRMFLSLSLDAHVEESGHDERSKHLVFCALVAQKDDWEPFANEWWRVLCSPKVLRKGKRGRIYYKSSEADNQIGCFEGFTDAEMRIKVNELTDVITRKFVNGYGLCVSVPLKEFVEIVKRHNPLVSGKKKRYLDDPYYLAFMLVIDGVLTLETSQRGIVGQRIDFWLDDARNFTERCRKIYNEAKVSFEHQRSPLADIMGNCLPVDDTEILPLQAADLIASRYRKWKGQTIFEPYSSFTTLLQRRQIISHDFTAQDLKSYIDGLNSRIFTKLLGSVKEANENR